MPKVIFASTGITVSVSGCYKAVVRVLNRMLEQTAEGARLARAMELKRLDVLQAALWELAENGQNGAINCIVRIMKRRAKVLGLDVRRKANLNGNARPSHTLSDTGLPRFNPTAGRYLAARELEQYAMTARAAGVSYREISQGISKKTGVRVSPSACYNAVTRVMDEIEKETPEELEYDRILETTRLDRLQSAVWNQAENGQFEAVDTVLNVMKRRAKLLGLDAAVNSVRNSTLLQAQIDEILAAADAPSIDGHRVTLAGDDIGSACSAA